MIRGLMAACGLAAAWLAAPAWGFDTAPHATITEQAMALAGYNRGAADVAQVENWLTDYYTSSPTRTVDKCALEKLHFDDVFTDADVDAYWKTLLRNARAAAVKAKADNDYFELWTVIGVSLHVVQDFYAHSNWVESSGYAGQGFDTTTYLQWRSAPWKRTAVVHTGWYPNCLNIPQDGHEPHGGYYGAGMNHDSVVRPGYSRAYVYALAASVEWLEQIRQAVAAATVGDPQFATKMLTFTPDQTQAQALSRDQAASISISEWVVSPVDRSVDGHWNGPGSGYAIGLATALAIWTGSADSQYVRAFKTKGVPEALSQGLYAPFAGADPPVSPTPPMLGTMIDMRTRSVYANRNLTGISSYFGVLAPFYGGGQGGHPTTAEYPSRDAAQIHRPRTDVPWEYLSFAPAWGRKVALRYSVGDETDVPPKAQVPINGADTVVEFVCQVSPGAACVWGAPIGSKQPMPPSLGLKGDGASGVTLDGISIRLVQAGPRP